MLHAADNTSFLPALLHSQEYAKNHQAVLDLVVSHQGLAPKEELVKNILSTFVLPAPVPYRSLLRRFAALSNKNCAEVALRAQQLLVSVWLSRIT